MIETKHGKTYRIYREYLQSDCWQKVRKEFHESEFNKGECWHCGDKDDLQLHHKDYKRIGQERPCDFVQLCGKCHRRAYKRAKKEKRKAERERRQARRSKPSKKKREPEVKGIFRVFK